VALPAITLGTTAEGQAILVNSATGEPFEVRGVNYNRPSAVDAAICPELQFGSDSRCEWDIETIMADMELLQDYGVNTIRLFLNYYAFGGATEHYAAYPLGVSLRRLETLIDAANQAGIYVMPVLLAKYPQHRFGPQHYQTALDLHVRPVVQYLAGRPGIIAWDIFNEPDLGGPVDSRCWDWANEDFDLCLPLANERMYFLQMLRDEVKRLDPDRPLTISLGFAKNYFQPSGAVMRLADMVDFYAFHYYDNEPFDSGRYQAHWYYGAGFPHDLQRAIAELTNLGLNKPTVITELGYPSGEGTLRTLELVHQDLATSMQVAREGQTSGVMVWPFRPYPQELTGGVFW
jgi:endo-1,4-beta-mannosidase